MPLRLYNTLSRKIEEFKPANGDTVNLYTCGPTVYDSAHIGNLRSYIFADILRRALKYNGYKVNWVMNITDVDDKTIKRTIDKYGHKATPKELREYTDEYFEDFKKDLAEINVPIDSENITFIRVSDKIEEIKKFIKELIKKGYAYKTDDGVYFSIEKYQKEFGDYGELVGPGFLEGKKVGARVKVDEYEKENLSDFALWKKRDESDGNIFWDDEELGEGLPDRQDQALQAGRPGWHIECSVINKEAFGGAPTDIHTGGVDLIFPHHTNEIAQSQPLYKPFVNHWSHCEHLLVDGKKMAKSAGNFYTLKDLEKEIYDAGMSFRYLTLLTNYRKQMNFTMAALSAAKSGLEGLNKYISDGDFDPAVNYEEDFKDDLDDDLNTAGSLGVLYTQLGYKGDRTLAEKMADILGIKFIKTAETAEIPLKIKELAAEREKYRRNEQFIEADRLRKEIDALGFIVEDTPEGPAVKSK
ncbi:MAG TPA: cysteine--tRNA ligase [Candidatus Paceibacterota bacterium]|nr:cysteine--tRNA ligase [Candidatus Paceibacterota bacterium]